MNRIIHFEIPTKDPKRASEFYKDIFSWVISKWEWPEEYWSVVTWPEWEPWINWWLEKKDNPWYVCVIDVPNIDEYIDRIITKWWILVEPKREVIWAWHLAYFKDTEGNVFWIIETNMEMKK